MKYINLKNLSLVFCLLVLSKALFADDANVQEAIAQQNNSRMNQRSSMQQSSDSWMPYYVKTKDAEPLKCFYQQTVGIGFLYFTGIRGNLRNGFDSTNTPQPKSTTILQNPIGYNRTPVYEMMIGRDIWFWLKVALSYTHQGGIVIQTSPQFNATTNGNTLTDPTGATATELTSKLRLDAILFRVFFMSPYTLVWKKLYFASYLSAGVGPGWQTWADNKSYAAVPDTWRMKVSANCVFTADLGSCIRKAMPTYMLSFNYGCKFTLWGQARSIGKINQQYISTTRVPVSNRQYLSNPLRIRTVYSFVPYIGMQLNF